MTQRSSGDIVMVRLGESSGFAPGWVRSHGDDFLCLPLVLSLVLTVHRLNGRSLARGLPVSHGLLAVGVFAVFFEVILPAAGSGAVGDPLDIMMYLAGFLVFQLVLNRGVAESPDHADLAGMNFSPLSRIS